MHTFYSYLLELIRYSPFAEFPLQPGESPGVVRRRLLAPEHLVPNCELELRAAIFQGGSSRSWMLVLRPPVVVPHRVAHSQEGLPYATLVTSSRPVEMTDWIHRERLFFRGLTLDWWRHTSQGWSELHHRTTGTIVGGVPYSPNVPSKLRLVSSRPLASTHPMANQWLGSYAPTPPYPDATKYLPALISSGTDSLTQKSQGPPLSDYSPFLKQVESEVFVRATTP